MEQQASFPLVDAAVTVKMKPSRSQPSMQKHTHSVNLRERELASPDLKSEKLSASITATETGDDLEEGELASAAAPDASSPGEVRP